MEGKSNKAIMCGKTMSYVWNILICAAIVLGVGCTTGRNHPAFELNYPFFGSSLGEPITEVKVHASQPGYSYLTPITKIEVNGRKLDSRAMVYSFRVNVVEGKIPKKEDLKSFWMTVHAAPVTHFLFERGGGLITLCFDSHGNAIEVKEIADNARRLYGNGTNSIHDTQPFVPALKY